MMRFRIGNESVILACLLVIFACRAVLVSVIVPPWQGPDEPAHFVPARQLAVHNYMDSQRSVQTQVLESMKKYRWWEAYGGPPPDPMPTEFWQVGDRLPIATYSQPIYYGLGAAALRLAPTASIDGAYWRLRILSILLALATLALAWSGTRLLFGSTVALGATAIAVLNPQFLLTAISVNPDALVILMGAFIWRLVASVVAGRRVHMSLALIVVTAVAAVITKRNAAPFAALAVLVAMGWFFRRTTWWRVTWRTAALSGILLAAGAVILWRAGPTLAVVGPQLATFWSSGLVVRRPPERRTLLEVLEYARISLDYVWLVAGWLKFSPSEPWLWVVRSLTVAGFAGAAVFSVRSRTARGPLGMAWLFALVQIAAVVGWGFLTVSSPQGRYLFPVIGPATALLWMGLTQGVPVRFQPHAAPALVAVLTVMDVTAFTTVLIPAYLPWG